MSVFIRPRSFTLANTYAQAMSDIDAALAVLSKDKNTGHFNYLAAKMLQGKMALYKGDYNLAYTANLLSVRTTLESSVLLMLTLWLQRLHFRLVRLLMLTNILML